MKKGLEIYFSMPFFKRKDTMKHLKKTKRNRHHKNNLLRPVLFLICCVGFLICARNYFSVLLAEGKADRAYSAVRDLARQEAEEKAAPVSVPAGNPEAESPEIPAAASGRDSFSVDIRGLQKEYPELSAWLRSEGAGIDYPVMHTKDNEYYLTRLYDGTENVSGSLFADYRNTGILTDANTVIYGHNMKNGGMFHPVEEYKSQDFYDANPTMRICTAEGDYVIELIGGTVESGDEEFVWFGFDGFEDMKAYVDSIRARSTFESGVELQPGDRLVSLCTCNYDKWNARYMLVGRVPGTAFSG